ncbi:MAG TPA: hypothetical protein VFG30_18480 [Polyangiales bacterium]|nr:hypothetical protein [Polyangiales bacterium]
MQNQFVVRQSFNNLEFFHEAPSAKNIYNTGVFELRRCAVRRENVRFGLRDQKNQKHGKDGQLERATTTAAESCSGAREAIKNSSSLIKRNRKKSTIDHNNATARPSVR